MYHGTPGERAELRRTVLVRRGSNLKADRKTAKTAKSTKAKPKKGKRGRPSKPTAKASQATDHVPLRRSGRSRKSAIVIESESEDDDMKDEELYQPKEDEDEDEDEPEVINVDNTSPDEEDAESALFPIVLTTYEMIIRDRVHLAHYDWGYIVVDEGHRLKNLDCKLMKEIKKYKSAGRMILTGTPLHVSFFFPFIRFLMLIPDYF